MFLIDLQLGDLRLPDVLGHDRQADGSVEHVACGTFVVNTSVVASGAVTVAKFATS